MNTSKMATANDEDFEYAKIIKLFKPHPIRNLIRSLVAFVAQMRGRNNAA